LYHRFKIAVEEIEPWHTIPWAQDVPLEDHNLVFFKEMAKIFLFLQALLILFQLVAIVRVLVSTDGFSNCT
jgi:hypothetical protein